MLVVLASLAAGCHTARYVHQDPSAGVVAIPHNTSSWPFYHRRQAEKLMAAQFPSGYEIVTEQEVVVGQKTEVQDNSRVVHAGPADILLGGETVTTNNQTEWRIHYRAK